MYTLAVKKTHPDARVPTRATSKSAGYDLYTCEQGVVKARSRALVRTGICIQFNKYQSPFSHAEKLYGSIRARSGLDSKYGITTGAGVIDQDYMGEIKVLLHNHSDQDYVYDKNDRVAQLIIQSYVSMDFVREVDSFGTESERQENGFGSSGK